MKSVLISIQPKWCELIASGKKTVEVRKTVPKLELPFKCYIYCTKKKKPDEYGSLIFYKDPNGICVENGEGCSPLLTGMVIGEFVCDNIFAIEVGFEIHNELPDRPMETWIEWEDAPEEYETVGDIEKASCLTMDEIESYICGGGGCYCWHISNLVIYDEPKPLSEFYKCGAVPMEDLDEELCNHCPPTGYGDTRSCYMPNGLQMCEGRWCAEAYQRYLDDEFALTRAPQSWCYVEEA